MRTRVLQIIPGLNKGGAERLVLDICMELQRRECEVRLVTFCEDNEYEFLTKNIDWVVVKCKVQLSVTGKNQIEVKELQQAIEDFAPDAIHSHLFMAEVVSRSCYYPEAKWFSHGHDNMAQFANFSLKTSTDKKRFTNYFEKKYLFKRYKINGGNNFIAISNNSKQYLQQTTEGFPVVLIHNAIDFERFSNHGNKEKGLVLQMVNTGSFIDIKNHAFLLDIAHVLKQRGLAFQLHLLGDGKNRAMIEEKIKRYSLDTQVILHGKVNNVESYLWKSDIYIHTALLEGLGLVLIEAMAAGLPVVTLDGKGNRDLIEEGKNGYMIYEQDAGLFADTIIKLHNDKNLYNNIAAYAKTYAAGFDIKEYADKLLALYRK